MEMPLPLLAARKRASRLQHLLDLLPFGPGDDRLVLALVVCIVMRYIPGVNRARENPVDGCGVPRFCRMFLAGADGHPLAGPQPQPVDLRDSGLNGLQRHIFLEDLADGFRLVRGHDQLLRVGIGPVAQHRNAAAEFSALFASLNGRLNAIYNQVPFEGCKGDQNIQQHPAGAGAGIDVLCDTDEVHPVLFEEFLKLHEIDDRPGQTVNLEANHHVNFTGFDVCFQPLHRGPVHVAAGISAVIIMVRQADPAFLFLAGNVIFASLTLGDQRIEVAVERGILHALPGVAGASYFFIHHFTPKNFFPFHCVPVMANAAPERDL